LTHRKLRITIANAEISGDPSPRAPYERFEWKNSSALDGLGMSSLAQRVLSASPYE
jgi:hypothetical protein